MSGCSSTENEITSSTLISMNRLKMKYIKRDPTKPFSRKSELDYSENLRIAVRTLFAARVSQFLFLSHGLISIVSGIIYFIE